MSAARSQDQDDMNQIFSNLLGDINLDITFNSPSSTMYPEFGGTASTETDEVEEVGVETDSDPLEWDSGIMDSDDLFIDESPSSMFSSFGDGVPFGGLFDRIRSMTPFNPFFGSGASDFTQYQTAPNQMASKPLFLMVQSMNNPNGPNGADIVDDEESEDIPVEDGPFSSVFRLQHNNRVSGNTFRYTITSDGANQRVFTQSWSTPSAPKMYLCSS